MAHREWTERHIRELVQNELKKLKGGAPVEEMVRMIDLSSYFPAFDTGGYSIGGLLMKNWYFYSTGEDTMRVECPVYSPGGTVYQNVTSVYSYEGRRIIGVTLTTPNLDENYWGCPIYYSQKHFEDQSESGIPQLSENHNPGMVVYKWSPYADDGSILTRPFARLRDQEGHVADFNLGIFNANHYEVEERTETMKGLRLGFIVNGDNNLTNWNLYDFNYKDYYYPELILPGAFYTNTICFVYYRSFAYAVDDSYFVS